MIKNDNPIIKLKLKSLVTKNIGTNIKNFLNIFLPHTFLSNNSNSSDMYLPAKIFNNAATPIVILEICPVSLIVYY